ncbi:MAG: SGNH/GDSL hydrolase family protein [Prolixibacteraceae bacterium]
MRRRDFIKSIGSAIVFSQIPFSACQVSQTRYLKGDEKILFIGDSITAAGYYVNYMEAYLNSIFPDNHFDIINLGLSSETISGLSEEDHPFPRPCILDRIDRVLELVKPDLVFACYGMNCPIYHPFSESRFEKYKNGIDVLIRKTKIAGAKLILLAPPPYTKESSSTESNENEIHNYSYLHPYARYDDVLKQYASYIMGLQSNNLLCIDLRKAMIPYKNIAYGSDPIHPLPCGHYVMAMTILNALGFYPEAEKAAIDYESEKSISGKITALRFSDSLSFDWETKPLVLFKEFEDFPPEIKNLYLDHSNMIIQVKALPKDKYKIFEDLTLVRFASNTELNNGITVFAVDGLDQKTLPPFIMRALKGSKLISQKRKLEKLITSYLQAPHTIQEIPEKVYDTYEKRNEIHNQLKQGRRTQLMNLQLLEFQ